MCSTPLNGVPSNEDKPQLHKEMILEEGTKMPKPNIWSRKIYRMN